VFISLVFSLDSRASRPPVEPNAVEQLRDPSFKHRFGPSVDFDLVLDTGERLPPKAVFGIAASAALGFEVQPKHFSGGRGTPCFRILEEAGFTIVPKNEVSNQDDISFFLGGQAP
jgi:hypothetical protein